jgi:UDP-galactopyranose mutase
MSVVTFPGSKSVDSYGVVCFSHLRWNFVFQRPQHLLSRFAKKQPVLFIEEPMRHDGPAEFVVNTSKEGVMVAVPHLPNELSAAETETVLGSLVKELVDSQGWENYIAWYYTPMMLPLSEGLNPAAVVYDCMDELSAFKNAPAELREREAELFRRADLVFTGGRSLYEAKREQHDSVYCFPSSIDVKHFQRALEIKADPEDQQNIERPRIGFVGVIDERMDIDLLGKAAQLRPDWQFVMIGPVVKISEEDLPRAENIHYLGGKNYDELPDYIGGWDVAMMPFAINESTRFISPTKTPEYLAAGRPVVSTPIRDVVRPYGESGLVRIAETAEEFVAAIEQSLNEDVDALRTRANEFLDTMSWDKTQSSMSELISEAIRANSKQYAEASVSK